MPHRLLRNGEIVIDDWVYAPGAKSTGEPCESATNAAAVSNDPAALIVGFDQWHTRRDELIERGGRLGIVLQPAHAVEQLVPDLAHFSLVAAEFPGPSDGRGYTQGRLLRERYAFDGELRAIGYVRRDQLFFLARCGFNSFDMQDHELEDGQTALSTFTLAYQPTNDKGLAPQHAPLNDGRH
jgi:uncharacterized protein (DUF934 family)